MSKVIKGIIPPVVTPFKKDGSIDEEKIRKEMRISINAGVNGISVGGSTGEGPTLRDEELRDLIGIAKEEKNEDQTIVCGVMRTCTRDAVRAGLVAKEAGADAIMVTPTAYNVLVPNEDGMFDFYNTISKEVGLPIIIYNVIPQNTITPRLFRRLLQETENVYGVKQSVGGLPALYAMDLVKQEVGRGTTFAATDEMLFSCFAHGADGAISAILSVFPKASIEMYECAQNGNYKRGMELQGLLYEPWQRIGGNQFPIRLKYALSVLGRDGGYCRSPITTLPEEEKRSIEKAFEKLASMDL